MEKRDWRQYVRQEKVAATSTGRKGMGNGGNPSDSSASSPTRDDQDMRADGTDDTNAYRPEMDEMRCFLWAHGGAFECHVAIWPLFISIYRWLLFRERQSGTVRIFLGGDGSRTNAHDL